jgi:3'-5' exoribonuclease
MQVDDVFRVADRQIRANRQGNLYLLLQLQDRTGVISGMKWNADEKMADRFNRGHYVRIQGASQLHNGLLQLIVNQIQVVDEDSIQVEDFDTADRVDVDVLWSKLVAMVDSMKDPTLSQITKAFLQDEEIKRRLCIAPAGIKAHHAYPGGLLEHVVSLMELADRTAVHYSILDRDMIVAGAMLHDIGKLEELLFDGELAYSDAGQLVGHLVQGVQLLDKKVAMIEATGVVMDRDRIMRLQHIIVSHHGSLEHGSPKVAMTLEALAFHYLDEMDAKLNSALAMIQADRTKDSWTPFNPTLGRKILKPRA